MFEVNHYLDEYVRVVRRLDQTAVERLARVLLAAWRAHRTVFCCGNGGSASSACHFATDLTKLTVPDGGRRLRVMSLVDNVSAMTAIANDIAYQEVFVEQMRTFLAPGDVVVAFSTSGSSANVLRAVEYANAAGAITLGITGLTGRKLEAVARYTLIVRSDSVQQIEDATMTVGHLLCLRMKELIERESQETPLGEERILPARLRAAGRAAL
jgi:D-sedoheptulose 7-phosphate isomerase